MVQLVHNSSFYLTVSPLAFIIKIPRPDLAQTCLYEAELLQ